MNEYWLGVLTIPAVALLIALAGTAVFGTWLLLEKWAEHRLVKMPPVKITQLSSRPGAKFQLRTRTETGGRGVFASLLLTVDKAWFFQIGPNTGIGFVHGKGTDDGAARLIRQALDKTLDELAMEGKSNDL